MNIYFDNQSIEAVKALRLRLSNEKFFEELNTLSQGTRDKILDLIGFFENEIYNPIVIKETEDYRKALGK